MILSVSRRTDIPAFYGDWFLNRIKEGFVLVRNPVNPKQVSWIALTRENVDCIVFWTKNPSNFMHRLKELKDYPFYFQFTLNGYGKEIEPGIPDKEQRMIPLFKELSGQIGRERNIWRYDPVLISEKYSLEWQIRKFEEMAASLGGYADRVVISFLDVYKKIKIRLSHMGIRPLTEEEVFSFAEAAGAAAGKHGMEVVTCAEKYDLSCFGIQPGSCVDRRLVEKVIGMDISVDKDKNQRSECGCAASIDIGAYDTCPNGCVYCYANRDDVSVKKKTEKYSPESLALCSEPDAYDRIKERKAETCVETQLSLFAPDMCYIKKYE
ncbi:DUF1848 domain-containing protein [Anaerostipes sp.]|uniref:DUF1848 domain-containing protein n=1 Tax=Anaerostipes sp. TaxID=1872530 RepID=UPI0025BEBF00|nr:DUF1848 domain-containing protein [Anaerostipes sp.]MBS7006774.1 DUF1848 domain-containing protein [Anaerostipes sp.]